MKTPRPLNVRQLEAFRAVILTGSMTAAGRFLSISQPAVTRLIREFEDDLKLDLFVRDGSRIMPTEEARALFKEVERHYAGTERIREAAYALREFKGTRIKIAANLSVTLTCLPQAVARFESIFPQSVISVKSGVSTEIIELVSSESVDIGFAAVRPGRRDVGTATLVTSEWLCIIPRGHPLERLDEINPKHLHGVDFISVGPSSMSRRELEAMLLASGVSPCIRLETPYSISAASFVRQGLGVALVDPLAACQNIHESIVLKRFSPTIPYVLSTIYPFSVKPVGLVEEFANVLRAVCEESIQGLGLAR